MLFRFGGVLLMVTSLAACGSHSRGGGGGGSYAQRGQYKVGAPYKIDGVTYTPQEEFNHVETGIASWYGPGFHGKSTANGEQYDQADRTAAHRTLQMPAVVRVTNLDNGLSTVVRINDRGPYARNRIIDLSRTAAQELDIVRNGTGHVRIDQLTAESLAVKDVALAGGGPAEQNAAVAQAASGQRAAPAQPQYAQAPPAQTQYAQAQYSQAQYSQAQYTQTQYVQQQYAQQQPVVVPATPPSVQPTPAQLGWSTVQQPPTLGSASTGGGPSVASLAAGAATASAIAPGGSFFVQIGSYGTAENAERQRGQVSSYGSAAVSRGVASGREIYRVRLGPYSTADAASIVADRIKRSGYGDARVVAE